MRKYIFLFLSFVGLLPEATSAHVKWFVDSEEALTRLHSTTVFYSWGSKEILIWSSIVFFVVVLFGFIDSKLRAPKKLVRFGLENEEKINRIAQGVLGLFLISVTFLWGIVIVPDLGMDTTLFKIAGFLQAGIGMLYLFNIRPRFASLAMLILTVIATFYTGFETFFENMILISLGIYFYIIHSPKESLSYTRLHKHAVEIVRVGTGVSLIVLAFTEKLLYPELSLAFLEVHPWNFMQPLFPWFTNELFVLSTGFAEMIFGILFIMGYITRITTILIAIFFAISVTTMLVQFGAWEVEDLVVYSAATILLFFGHGHTKFFHFSAQNIEDFQRKCLKFFMKKS